MVPEATIAKYVQNAEQMESMEKQGAATQYAVLAEKPGLHADPAIVTTAAYPTEGNKHTNGSSLCTYIKTNYSINIIGGFSMGKYDEFNKIVPKGNGKCHQCNGGTTRGFPLGSCYTCDNTGVCYMCEGKGIREKFGSHCTHCQNNYDKYYNETYMAIMRGDVT